MLRKSNRLSKDKEFKKVFRFSKKGYFGKLALRFTKNNQNESRFGFIVSNKIDKRATVRNALRRRLRAAAKELLPCAESGFDIIIMVKERYSSPLDYNEIKKDLTGGLKSSGLLK